MSRFDRFSRGRLARPNSDEVGGVLLRKQTDVRCAGELDTYRFLAVVPQPVANAGGKPFVGDANVLPYTEAGDAREGARRRLEDEAYGARLTLRGQLVVVRMQHDRLGLSDAEAVLEERAARDVVLEQLRETALFCAHRLVDGLRLFFGGLPDEDLPKLLSPPKCFVFGLRPARERVHEVGGGRVDVPLDDGAALHVDEHRARVPAEDVLVVAVDVVVALLAGRGAPLRQDPFRFQERRVRIGADVREVDPAEDAVPVHVVPLRTPEVLLGLTDLG